MKKRRGFSLLEVIIATGILAGSAVVLMSMFSTGDRHARRAEERTMAQMLCQAKLQELLADKSKLIPVQAEVSPQYPGWVWSIDALPSSLDGLIQVRVAVTHIPGMPTGASLDLQSSEELVFNSIQLPSEPTFELTRWMQFDGDVADFAELRESGGLETTSALDRLNSGRPPWSSE